MFVSSAFAADTVNSTSSAVQQVMGSGAMPMLMIFAILYFLIIRPNQKKIKDHETMTKALRRGDKIVTTGGVIGVISKIEEDNNIIVLEVADNIKIRVLREAVSNVINKAIANDNKVDSKAVENKLGDKSTRK